MIVALKLLMGVVKHDICLSAWPKILIIIYQDTPKKLSTGLLQAGGSVQHFNPSYNGSVKIPPLRIHGCGGGS